VHRSAINGFSQFEWNAETRHLLPLLTR